MLFRSVIHRALSTRVTVLSLMHFAEAMADQPLAPRERHIQPLLGTNQHYDVDLNRNAMSDSSRFTLAPLVQGTGLGAKPLPV